MVLPRFYARLQKSSLLPGNDCTPAGYEYQFLDGFRYGYQAIRDKKEEVFSLLERYKHFAVRYLLRSTGFYNTMIAEYTAAASNKERECILGRLEKGLDDAQKQYWRPIIDCEAACVSEGDVPYFWFYANERTLRGDRNGVRLIDGFLIESPIDYAKYRILRMDQYDLAGQCSYIQASMKHIDGWTDPAARFFRPAERIPDRLTPPLAAELAVREAVEVLHAIWDERIPLSGGRCLWHVPMIDGKTSSLYGLSEGFAGIGVFCRAMTDSRLLTGMDAVMAEELAQACLQDMLAFGGYLLNEYPDPPSERIIMRRFDGGFGFENGLAGFLWALEHIRDTQNREIERMLEAFSEWHIRTYCEGALEKLCMTEAPSWADTDILAGGVAGYAVSMMSAFTRGDTTALGRAGCMLAWMVEQKKITGCYKLFRAGRKQYFLSAFLRGNAGIAYVMLHYAKLSDVHKSHVSSIGDKTYFYAV